MGASQFIPLIMIVAVFYFLIMRPQQKRAKEHKDMLDNLKKGDVVVTTGGLIGRISGMTDAIVTLEVAEKIRLRVVRGHIASKQAGDIPAAGSN